MKKATLASAAALWITAGWLQAEGLAALNSPVTVVLDAERPLPSEALETLKSEMSRLFTPSGVRLQWAERSQAGLGFEAPGIVVVKLRGDCRMPDLPMPPDERGPLAWTHVTADSVLPYSEVSCEQMKRVTHSALHGGEHARRQELMGRALGRVVAHELLHILLKRRGHEAKGIFRRGLTARDLVEDFGDEERGRVVFAPAGKPAS